MIDFHTHLDLIEDDLRSVILRAKAVGVDEFVVPGVYGFPQKLEALRTMAEVKICWGIFPKYAEEVDIYEKKIVELAKSGVKLWAIGECGLDKRFGNLDAQIELFKKQIDLSKELKLPLVIHLVGHYGKAYELLADASVKFGFLLHSWTGSAQMARKFVKLGGKISLSAGILRTPKKVKELFDLLGADSIVFETDSPDQKPEFWQKDYNEPAVLPKIIYEIKKLSLG